MTPALQLPEVTILAGSNDLRTKCQNEEQYAFIVDKGVEKIKKLAKTPGKLVTLAYFKGDTFEPALPPDMAKYLKQGLLGLKTETVNAVTIPDSEIDMDASGHPTEGGTRKILLELDHYYDDSMLLNADYLTNAGVESVFRYGCRREDGQFPRPLEICPDCISQLGQYNGAEKLATGNSSVLNGNAYIGMIRQTIVNVDKLNILDKQWWDIFLTCISSKIVAYTTHKRSIENSTRNKLKAAHYSFLQEIF